MFKLDPVANRSYHYWHAFVPEVKAGQIYGYRIDGPSAPEKGLLFDPASVLLDPYGRGVVVPKKYNRRKPDSPEMAVAAAMKSVVVDPADYDWDGDKPLRHSSSRTIVYEMHVRGFTQHPSSGVDKLKRGTYAGLIEKIPYLQQLGVTAVELLPVFQFDALDCPLGNVNYWGYAPVSFFAPHARSVRGRRCSGRSTGIPAAIWSPGAAASRRHRSHSRRNRSATTTRWRKEISKTARRSRFPSRRRQSRTYYILAENGGAADTPTTPAAATTFNANQPIVRRLIPSG